jgi:hypothetical protein
MQQTKKSNSFLRPDNGIYSRIKFETKYQEANFYDRKMKSIGVSTNWFENQQKMEVKNNKKRNDKNIMKELIMTNLEIKLRRNERLKELYLIEANM